MKNILLFVVVFSSFAASAEHLSSQTCPGPDFENDGVSIEWDGAEHRYLGDIAYKSLCAEFSLPVQFCPNKFSREDKKNGYSYGQMAALGDFYVSGDSMFEESSPGNITRTKNIFKCMDKEGRAMHEQRTNPEVNFPNCDWVYILNSKKYLTLAANNFDHFSWGAVKAYVREHEKALRLAKLSFESRQQGKLRSADYYFRRAFFVNAVADHYLMDLFAAGHVDIPRVQLRQFAQRRLSGLFKKIRGDALSMLLHENNSKDEQLREVGLRVENLFGEEWLTHSDGHMMTCSSDQDPVIYFPLLAVKVSLQELYDVLMSGEGTSTYGALEYLPRLNQPSLAMKFKYLLSGDSTQVNRRINRFAKILPFPLRAVTSNTDIQLMIRSLPAIEEQYKKDLRHDLETSKQLQKRLSPQVKSFWLK